MSRSRPDPAPDAPARTVRGGLATLALAGFLTLAGCAGSGPAGTPAAGTGAPEPAPPGATTPSGSDAGARTGPPAAGAGPSAGAPGPSAPAASPLPSPAPLVLTPELATRLQAVADDAIRTLPAPGISLAVLFPDGTLWTGVAGQRQAWPDRPVTPGTLFAIASITKTFVAARVLQLADEGAIDLDAPARRYVPDLPIGRDVTVRMLLAHRSGIRDYFQTAGYLGSVFDDRNRAWTPREILGWMGPDVCAPGACFHYSNTNFVLLGLLIEEVTGRPLAKEIRGSLLQPLGLTEIVFQPDEPTPRDAAHGHLWGGRKLWYDQAGQGTVMPHLSAATAAWAAGAMAASARDLARWGDALYAGEVLPRSLRAEMLDFGGDAYGLGARSDRFAGRRAVGHLGGIRGFVLALWHFRAEDVTVVVLVNRGIASTDPVTKAIARALFGGEPGEEPGGRAPSGIAPELMPPPPRDPMR